MNAEQIAKMKELAKNASPGPWFTQTHCADNGEHSHIGLESQEGAELIGEEVMPCDADMRFIAAANPAAVLELIALAERTTSPVSELTNEQIIAIADRTKTAESRDGDYILPISFARAILAAAAPQAQAVEPAVDPRPLFDRKLADLQQRGYEVIGRILHKDGEYALFDSSCRWLTQPQYWRLMHEQDGSLFAAPAAPVAEPSAAKTTITCELNVMANHEIVSVVGFLLDVAQAAHLAMQDCEDCGDHYKVQREDFDALNAAMEKLEVLPDDRPGYTLSGPGKAEWALRDRGEAAGTFMAEEDARTFGTGFTVDGAHVEPSRVRVFTNKPVAEQGELPKWINDQKGKDPLMDDMIHYIEQLRAAIAASQHHHVPATYPWPERDATKPAEQQGLFRKFEVRRVDGSDQPGGKHFGCHYFVLDMVHDAHAPAAIRAYAASCRATHPELAQDIEDEWGTASQQAAEPVAWRTEFVVEAAKQSGFIRSEACCSDPLKFCEGDHWKGNIEGFAKAMVRLAAPAIQQPQDERVAMMEKP